jgi:hypothetical protein
MATTRRLLGPALILLGAAQVSAQGTGGVIEGRITDEQGRALAGTSVTVVHAATGLERTAPSDDTGLFRFPGLPVGAYEVRAEHPGIPPVSVKDLGVNVAATTVVDFTVALALQTEAVRVTTAPPLIDPLDSGVGEVVTQVQVAHLPLNGRQFANLGALAPGVSLGSLVNQGKSTQFAPWVAGGGGRNVNYLVDGGEHNDDRRGGLTQLFPLDAIEEFNFQYRFKPEHGRASGGVFNVVTKAGTNVFSGSAFGYFRDKRLNALTERQKRDDLQEADFRRYQYGASLGGPIRTDRAHFFVSFERVHQDGARVVDTGAVFRDKEGVFDDPLRENIFAGKLTANIGSRSYLSMRYGYNDNDAVLVFEAARPPEGWSDVSNTYHSANASLGSGLAAGLLNELVFQYSSYRNAFRDRSRLPVETFPVGLRLGRADYEGDLRQERYELGDALTWTRGRHEIKLGARFIHEPVLSSTSAEPSPVYQHPSDERTSPIRFITVSRSLLPPSAESFPNRQYAAYLQDTLRATDRLTLDAGVRYDLVTRFAIDQSSNPLFRELQAAGAAGRLDGAIGLEDFGKEPRDDKNNLSGRAGLTWDVKGDGRLVFRGGVGRYYDFPYTDATVGRFGSRGLFVEDYLACDSYPVCAGGIRNRDGSFFRVGDPLPPNARPQPRVLSLGAVSPRVRQPYADQANLGLSTALADHYAVEVDAVYARGRDWGVALAPNVIVDPRRFLGDLPCDRPESRARRFSSVLPTTGVCDFGVAVSRARSHYKAVTLAVKRQWDRKLQLLSSYTLSKATAITTGASDEPYFYRAVEASDPFGAVQEGPTGTDARHRVNVSGVASPGWGFTVAAIFRYRSRTPYTVITGRDDNQDGANFDLPPGSATVNQARGADFKQLDLRISRRFGLGEGRTAAELIVEAFNVTNARNPSNFEGNQTRTGEFGQPRNFAGDAGAIGEVRGGEQRQARVGLRLTF